MNRLGPNSNRLRERLSIIQGRFTTLYIGIKRGKLEQGTGSTKSSPLVFPHRVGRRTPSSSSFPCGRRCSSWPVPWSASTRRTTRLTAWSWVRRRSPGWPRPWTRRPGGVRGGSDAWRRTSAETHPLLSRAKSLKEREIRTSCHLVCLYFWRMFESMF